MRKLQTKIRHRSSTENSRKFNYYSGWILDEKLLNRFITNAKADKPKFAEFSDEEILLQFGVLTQVEDKIFPTVAGIMVFGIYPQKFFPQWFVAEIVIPGFEVADLGEIGQRFDDNKRIEGNISEMYEETIGF